MTSTLLEDLSGAYDEDAYNTQQGEPVTFEDDVRDQESIIETGDRIREDAEGNIEYRYDDGSWIPAHYHINLRALLLCDAEVRGTYDFERVEGKDQWDKTSYLTTQKTWGVGRAHRPRILYMYEKPPEYQGRQDEVPYMYRYGWLVLSINGQPMLDYQDIPDVVSSQLEGYIMEAIMRLDRRITIEDFRARMPCTIAVESGQSQKALFGANTFASRMRRFRTSTFNVVWSVDRGGSKEIKLLFDSLLSPECKAANSTRNWHDLYSHEEVLQEMLNFGMFLERAGKGRGRTAEQREAAFRKLFAKFDKLYTSFKHDQQGFAFSGRADVHLVDDNYHRAVEDWISRIQAQRLVKKTGLATARVTLKRKRDTALEDRLDEEHVNTSVERTDQNPRRMMFGPAIEAPSKKRANMPIDLPSGYQTTAPAFGRSNGEPAIQHRVSSSQFPSNKNRQFLSKPTSRKRTHEESEDNGPGHAYTSPLHPSLQAKRQNRGQASGPGKNWHHPAIASCATLSHPVPRPAHATGRRRRSSRVLAKEEPHKRATNLPHAEIKACPPNSDDDDECSLEIASPSEAARISAALRSRKHNFPIKPYVADPPISDSTTLDNTMDSYNQIGINLHDVAPTNPSDSYQAMARFDSSTTSSHAQNLLVHNPSIYHIMSFDNQPRTKSVVDRTQTANISSMMSDMLSTAPSGEQLVDPTRVSSDDVLVSPMPHSELQTHNYSPAQSLAAQNNLVAQKKQKPPAGYTLPNTGPQGFGPEPSCIAVDASSQPEPAFAEKDPQPTTSPTVSRKSSKRRKEKRSFEEWLALDPDLP